MGLDTKELCRIIRNVSDERLKEEGRSKLNRSATLLAVVSKMADEDVEQLTFFNTSKRRLHAGLEGSPDGGLEAEKGKEGEAVLEANAQFISEEGMGEKAESDTLIDLTDEDAHWEL